MLMKVEDLREGMVFDPMPALVAGDYDPEDELEASVLVAGECEWFVTDYVEVDESARYEVVVYAEPWLVETHKGVYVEVNEELTKEIQEEEKRLMAIWQQ